MVATTNPLKIQWAAFDAVTAIKGWNTDPERAEQLGISWSHLINLRAGRAHPGRKFIDAVITHLGPEAYGVVFKRGAA